MSKVKQAALALAAAAALGLPSTSSAQMAGDATTGWYAGVSIGKSRDADSCSFTGGGGTCSNSDTAYRLFGGYQVNRYLALELGYHALGDVVFEATGLRQVIETKAYDLVAVGTLPLWEKAGLYGKLGAYYADTDITANVAPFSASTSNTGLTFGIGAQYEVTRNLAIRAEWQQFLDITIGGFFPVGRDVELFSVGGIWRFR